MKTQGKIETFTLGENQTFDMEFSDKVISVEEVTVPSAVTGKEVPAWRVTILRMPA